MRRSRLGALAACALALAVVPAVEAAAADPSATVTQGLTTPAATTSCNGAVQLQATVTAHGGSTGTKTAVVLALDLSGSTDGTVRTDTVNAAKAAIDALDAADGSANGAIANNEVGVVTYQGTQSALLAPVGTSYADLMADLGTLNDAGGGSPHHAGIDAAANLLAPLTGYGHGIVLISDGQTAGNEGDLTTASANAAKSAGDVIVPIAIGDSVDGNLTSWASDPASLQHGSPGPINGTKLVTDLGALQGAPVQFSFSDALGSRWAASAATASAGTVTPGAGSLGWSGSLSDGQSATLTWTATRDGSDVYARQTETIATATLNVVGGTGTVTGSPTVAIDVLPCGGSPLAQTTCTGGNCSLTATQNGTTYAVNAGSPPAGTSVDLTALNAPAPPAGACPGFTSHTKGAELDVRPLSTAVNVTLTIPKASLGRTSWLATDVCIGTNLPFVQATTSLRDIAPQAKRIPGANGLPGRWWGLLPTIPWLEYIPGKGFVTGPHVTDRSVTRGGDAVIKFVIPFVSGTAGTSTDGLDGYDPKIWG